MQIEKKETKIGGLAKNAKGWLEPPPQPVWGRRTTPCTRGWFSYPQKAKKKKKKNGLKWVLGFGGGRTTPKGLGWLRRPHTSRGGWPKLPLKAQIPF